MAHKLLLADDSVTIQRVIELTFADEDIEVLAVGDGQQAIARVQADRPDVVLADVGMPERDGYEVAAFIKGNPELAHIPVLLLTGAFEPIDESRARSAGCDGVLVKPFEPQMVINRVKDLLSGRRSAGSAAAASIPTADAQQASSTLPGTRPAPAAPPAAQQPPQPAANPAAQSQSLDDYFDRLDAAFASLEGGATPAAATPEPVIVRNSDYTVPSQQPQAVPPPDRAEPKETHDDLSGWDPDLSGDPARPATFDLPPSLAAQMKPLPPPVPFASPAVPQPPSPGPASPVAAVPAMAASSVGAGMPVVPQPPLPTMAEAFALLLSAEQGQPVSPAKVRPNQLSDDVIDDIVRRVAERMNDRIVRDTVLEVAERLVKEEIARIKGA